jgi:phospholipid-translocating ATPase
VTISKEAFDDYQRYKRDKEANSQLYQRMNVTGLQSIPSSGIKVGDMILIRKNQRVSVSTLFAGLT